LKSNGYQLILNELREFSNIFLRVSRTYLPSSSYEAATLRQSWHLFKDGTVVIVRYERSGGDVLHVPVCWPYDSWLQGHKDQSLHELVTYRTVATYFKLQWNRLLYAIIIKTANKITMCFPNTYTFPLKLTVMVVHANIQWSIYLYVIFCHQTGYVNLHKLVILQSWIGYGRLGKYTFLTSWAELFPRDLLYEVRKQRDSEQSSFQYDSVTHT
jgi:hypothetical protein